MDDWKKKLGDAHNRPNPDSRQNRPNDRGMQRGVSAVPAEFIFTDTFYNIDGNIKEELFYNHPKKVAGLFESERLKSTALRQLFSSYLKFASRLRDGRISFDKAREQFDVFYTERVVRQNNRRDSSNKPLLPDIVVDFVNRHRELVRKDKKEMLGFFRYLTSILCYFQGR